MQQKRWNQIETILDTALTLSGSERTTYINEICGTDDELIEEVYEMLRAIEESEQTNFLESVSDENQHLLQDFSRLKSDTDLIGTQIGAFQITEQLGVGGMGTVYKAKRTDGQFSQQVAIKVLQKGIQSAGTFQRFQLEQEILASLKHANIAQLYDGGVTDDGTPYLVMEYVDGNPIDEYCNKHQYTIEQRLELFRDVCSAVQFAHANLIIHRDLKADNIYVSKDGTVKVLDFGIAKLLDPTLTEKTLLETRPGQKFWTPQYAAPEQVGGSPVTIAADIYALGVLLHKLLTDTFPLSLKDKSLSEVEHIIAKKSPLSPSQSIEQSQHSQKTAQVRQTTPAALQKKLDGDLDAMVLKAIRKEPEYRYDSAGQFIEDLDRLKNGLPLLAQRDTVSYRLQKFIKRYRVGVASGAVFFLLIIAFSVTLVLQQRTTIRERDRAQQEAEKARQIATFVTNLFHTSNPENEEGNALTALDMLDRGTQQLREDMGSYQEVQATLFQTIGDAYASLGHPEQARPLLEEAVAMRRNQSPGSSELAEAILELALLESQESNSNKVIELLEEALQLQINHYGVQHDKVAEIHNSLGIELNRLGDVDRAINHYRAAINIRKKLLQGEPDADLAANLFNLATLLRESGNLEEAESLYRESLDMVTTALGTDHIFVAYAMGGVAKSLMDQNKHEEALSFLNKAFAILSSKLGTEHPQIATAYYEIAEVHRAMLKMDIAKDYYNKALKLRQKILAPDHPDLATSYFGLGMTLLENEQPDSAWTHIYQAVNIWEDSLPEGHWHTATGYGSLGVVLMDKGDYQGAEPYLLKSYTQLKDQLDDSSSYVKKARQYLAELYEAWEKPEQAAMYKTEPSED
ncbi:MAG: serine/threonine-protein kinase [Balneolaceae bacterium]|nr:serine/threonine-protein kinase [Balneolaceae bacterium]